MADKISRRSALETVYVAGPYGAEHSSPGITVTERRNLTIVSAECREDDDETIVALGEPLGLEMPFPGQTAEAGSGRAIWIGAGRWMVVCGAEPYGTTAGKLTDAAESAAVNDVSSSKTVLRVTGSAVRDVLAAGTTVDMDVVAFKPGMTVTTNIDHVTVTLDCLDADTVDIYVPRGFAISFWEWLIEASEEYGGAVVPPI